MTRFVGIKRNRVCVVSTSQLSNPSFQVLEVPAKLATLSNDELISDCIVQDNELVNKKVKRPANELKVAFVSNHKMKCGVSTYSEYLHPAIAKHIGDFKLFIEKNNEPTGDIHQFGNEILADDKVIACWKRGESLQELVVEIKKYSPDIVVIQHEFGIFPNARYWLSLMTQLSDYRVIVIMHSIFPTHLDKIVYEASIPEIVVHLEEAKNSLENVKEVSAKVSVIPHGCYPIIDQTKLWNNYKSQHTIISTGFGFKYKAFEITIKAIAKLKLKYPDIFFTAIFSESPQLAAGHQSYYNELITLAEELGVQENVAIIRGFQSDNVINTYLRSNQIAVLPYLSVPGHEVFGSSGSARLAMATGIPVISSSIPHFRSLPTIKADTSEQIAEEIDKLFCDERLKKQQIEKQNEFIKENSWDNIALKFVDLFEK